MRGAARPVPQSMRGVSSEQARPSRSLRNEQVFVWGEYIHLRRPSDAV